MLQNFIYFELNHLYRWHSMIPDQLDLLGGTPFPDAVFQPQLLTQVTHEPCAVLRCAVLGGTPFPDAVFQPQLLTKVTWLR